MGRIFVLSILIQIILRKKDFLLGGNMFHEQRTEFVSLPGGVATRTFYIESESDLTSIDTQTCYPGSSAYDKNLNIWIMAEDGTWTKQS
jgi:hypothetical protein